MSLLPSADNPWAKVVKTEAELLKTLTADDNVGVVFSESADRETPKEILAIMDKITGNGEFYIAIYSTENDQETKVIVGKSSHWCQYFDETSIKNAMAKFYEVLEENCKLSETDAVTFADWALEEVRYSHNLCQAQDRNAFSYITSSKINFLIADFANEWHRDGNYYVTIRAYTSEQTIYAHRNDVSGSDTLNRFSLNNDGSFLQGNGRSMHKGIDYHKDIAAIHKAPNVCSSDHFTRIINVAGIMQDLR